MAVITLEELKKIPDDTLIPVKYLFYTVQKAPATGYIERKGSCVHLKHNEGYFDGSGRTNVKGCKYSWKLTDNFEWSNLDHFNILQPVSSQSIGEL